MRTIVLAFNLLLFTSFAAAQIPTSGNIFAGYSYYNTNLGTQRQSLNGWEGSIEGKFFPIPFLGIFADFSANYGNLKFVGPCPPIPGPCAITTVNSHLDNFLLGPRVSVSIGKIRPFAQAEVGVAHVNTNGFGSDTSISSGVGGGIDYSFFHLLGWRIQVDYLHTHLFSAPQNNVRISTGLVFHF
jgi:Outer membrane protein beta-barrel domain